MSRTTHASHDEQQLLLRTLIQFNPSFAQGNPLYISVVFSLSYLYGSLDTVFDS
jgi:hypothetical protein